MVFDLPNPFRTWGTRKPVIEPFRHESNTRHKTKYVFAITLYLVMWAPIFAWIAKPDVTKCPEKNPLPELCSDTRYCYFWLLAVFVLHLVFEQVLAMRSKSKFDKVLPRGKWTIPDPVNPFRLRSEASPIQFSVSLATTARAIRERMATKDVGDTDGLREIETFLKSVNGREFLSAAHAGVRRFRVLDGKLVRKSRFKHMAFFMASNLCCMVAVLAALQDSPKCTEFRDVFLAFLEFLSITVLTLITITAFGGITEYYMLFIAKGSFPVTDDEKLLISLVAANSDFAFSAFKPNEHSDYARFAGEPCLDEDVWVHIPHRLRVYGAEGRPVPRRAEDDLDITGEGQETKDLFSKSSERANP